MSYLKFNFDAASIADQFGSFKVEVEKELREAIKGLALQVHGLIVEKAQQELHSTRDTYLNALTEFEEVLPGVWICTLDESAMFIEEGLPHDFDMKPGLLKNAKVSKNGMRYKVIPFNHSIPPSRQTMNQQTLSDQIKTSLKKLQKDERIAKNDKSINYLTIQKDANGSPRIGKVHANLDLGGTPPGKGNTPRMNGVNIYQEMNQKGTKANRTVMTFRTVTSGQTDKWLHPGLDAKKFMDKALDEAVAIFENQILPEILNNWKK